MKFKMAEKSLFAVLLRSPWWVSLVVATVLALLASALLPPAYRVVGALSATPFFVISVMAAWRQRHKPSDAQVAQTLATLSTLGWPPFAALLEQSFLRAGYTVKPGSGAAFDLELERGGRTTLVAARRWKSARIGLETLRALQQAREGREAADAVHIGLGELSESARSFAAEHRIVVWQAAELTRALRGLRPAA